MRALTRSWAARSASRIGRRHGDFRHMPGPAGVRKLGNAWLSWFYRLEIAP
jgi:hypothetical protein